MNSINEQQPEANHEDLTGREAVDKLRAIVEKAGTCFFCTAAATGESGGARPMSVRKIDEHGDLWFLSADDSHKNLELAAEPTVHLYFQATHHSGFLSLTGTAFISRDKEKIKELWEPIIATWFTGGVDDPRITVIRVIPVEGYYWDTKHGNLVAGAKMLLGAALRKTFDDSVEGRLRVA